MHGYILVDNPTGTYRTTSTNSATGIASSVLKTVGLTGANRIAEGVLMSVESHSIRIAFGATPTQGPAAVGHVLYSGQLLAVAGAESLERMKFISAVTGDHAAIQITPFYRGTDQ